jgi:hypothetical protein
MIEKYMLRPRRKAWLGAAIGAAFGIGSAIFGASKQKAAQQKQYALQQNTQYRNTGLTSAANMTQSFANANELDEEFRNRFLRYGGRRKAEEGGGFKWSSTDTDALISGLGSAGSNLATSLVGQAQQQGIYPNAFKPAVSSEKDNEAIYDSAARSSVLNNYYQTATLRLGGKRGRRC